jgi:predicted Zn-ribbon and HTH transcriptional regulator
MGKAVTLPVFHCKRCGHRWSPRLPKIPTCCGKCKSPYWDRERKGAKK